MKPLTCISSSCQMDHWSGYTKQINMYFSCIFMNLLPTCLRYVNGKMLQMNILSASEMNTPHLTLFLTPAVMQSVLQISACCNFLMILGSVRLLCEDVVSFIFAMQRTHHSHPDESDHITGGQGGICACVTCEVEMRVTARKQPRVSSSSLSQ